MMDFLKEFFTGTKPEAPKKRDVITLESCAMDAEEEETQSGGCCSGCGCGKNMRTA